MATPREYQLHVSREDSPRPWKGTHDKSSQGHCPALATVRRSCRQGDLVKNRCPACSEGILGETSEDPAWRDFLLEKPPDGSLHREAVFRDSAGVPIAIFLLHLAKVGQGVFRAQGRRAS